jgi:hypothetical protein
VSEEQDYNQLGVTMWLVERSDENVSATMWLMKRGEESSGNHAALTRGRGKRFSKLVFYTTIHF